MKQWTEARDGQRFEGSYEAAQHTEYLFEQWLKSNPTIDVARLLDGLDCEDTDEWYDTQLGVATTLVRWYWESLDDAEAVV